MAALRGFGAALRAIRGARTLDEMSELVAVTPASLSRYERERKWPSREVLERVLDSLGISFVEFAKEAERQALGGSPESPSDEEARLDAKIREIAREELGSRLAGLAGIPSEEFESYVRFIRAAGGEPDLEAVAVLRRILGGAGG